jgi:hypothetical protein
MTRDDILARLKANTNDLDLWRNLIDFDAHHNRTRDPAARQPTKTVKIGLATCQWDHLVDAAAKGVAVWHKAPNPGSKMLRGIVAIYPLAPAALALPSPPPTEQQDAEE